MSGSTKPILVVGAGPSGLMQALYLAQIRKRSVIVVEQQPVAGGLFASVTTPWGTVDQGVHILQETGSQEWDQLFFEILPRDEWYVLEGVRKDIGGNFFEGRLNEGCIYPDLRQLPHEDYLRCLGEMVANVGAAVPRLEDAPNLARYFEARFGPNAVRRVFEPLARKIWRRPLEALSPWAAKIVHLSRVVTHSAAETLALKQSKVLDAVIGFPEQLAFPVEMLSNQEKTLYPRRYGLHRVVEALGNALQRNGGEVLTSTQLRDVTIAGGRVESVQLASASGDVTRRVEVDAVLWTSPYFGLLRHLGLEAVELPDPALPHRLLYLFLDRPPRTGELYWLWSFDPGNSLVRVSNPAAYCPDAAAAGHYPLCIEMHVADASITDEDAVAEAERTLRTCGLIGADTAVVGGTVLRGGRAFLLPTVANLAVMTSQRRAIAAAGVGNLILSTADIGSGVFYLPDILNASTAQLRSL